MNWLHEDNTTLYRSLTPRSVEEVVHDPAEMSLEGANMYVSTRIRPPVFLRVSYKKYDSPPTSENIALIPVGGGN